jgi:hypothetical protein
MSRGHVLRLAARSGPSGSADRGPATLAIRLRTAGVGAASGGIAGSAPIAASPSVNRGGHATVGGAEAARLAIFQRANISGGASDSSAAVTLVARIVLTASEAR